MYISPQTRFVYSSLNLTCVHLGRTEHSNRVYLPKQPQGDPLEEAVCLWGERDPCWDEDSQKMNPCLTWI